MAAIVTLIGALRAFGRGIRIEGVGEGFTVAKLRELAREQVLEPPIADVVPRRRDVGPMMTFSMSQSADWTPR